jgi:type II secretory pathway component PulF
MGMNSSGNLLATVAWQLKRAPYFWSRKKLSKACRASLLATMEVQVSAGVDIVMVINKFHDRLRMRRRYIGDQPLLSRVISRIRGGASVAEALKPHLTDNEFAIFAAGEQSGESVQACRLVQALGQQGKRIASALREAMVAPAVYLISLFVTLFVISSQVVPSLASVLPAERWEGLAAVIYASTKLVSPVGIGILILLVAGAAGVVRFLLPRWIGQPRLTAERYVPGFGLYRDLMGALWVGSFATLLQSGLADTRILEMQIAQSNPWLAERLRRVLVLMKNGLGLGEALTYAGPGRFDHDRPEMGVKFDFPSPDAIDDIASFAGFSDFGTRMIAMRDIWLADTEKRLRTRAAATGMVIQMLIFAYFGILTLGINQLSSQIANAVH